jgi:hypothetical protein
LTLNKVVAFVVYTYGCRGYNNAYKSQDGKSQERDHFEDLGVDGRKILKWGLKKEDGIYPLILSKIHFYKTIFSIFLSSYLIRILTTDSYIFNIPGLNPGVDSYALEQQTTARFCEHGNETSDLLQEEEFLD